VIIAEQEKSEDLEEITVPHSTAKINLEKPATVTQLTKLKRQFMSLTRNSSVTGEPGVMFVQYLNSQFKDLS
jgi:tRNA uridine 5-carbamoylmethylation protein Kti12